MEEHKLLISFLDSNMGKHQLKIVSILVITPQVIHMKTWRKFIKLSIEIVKHSGCPATGYTYENKEKVKKIVHDN